ncbi:MAG: 50S ribosomal protein L10 [Candidatus Cloacimonetes bacterium]|nr:50S ribosomal protein L10 [Candidatus Cloacimonadota bacterium]MDD4156358.1 50S ribosomal protein L10 [Candidatus Cloacimonadota bacterium]
MANIKEYKLKTVENIKGRLDNARAIVLVDYKGITVEEVNKLRNVLRDENVEYFISKNTWIKIALNQLGITGLDSYLVGPTAVAVSKNDEVAPARILSKFIETELEKKEILTFKAGLIGSDVFQPAELKQLASLPSRDELIARVLSGFNAPISGFVGVLSGVIRKFALAVDAIAKQKAKEN